MRSPTPSSARGSRSTLRAFDWDAPRSRCDGVGAQAARPASDADAEHSRGPSLSTPRHRLELDPRRWRARYYTRTVSVPAERSVRRAASAAAGLRRLIAQLGGSATPGVAGRPARGTEQSAEPAERREDALADGPHVMFTSPSRKPAASLPRDVGAAKRSRSDQRASAPGPFKNQSAGRGLGASWVVSSGRRNGSVLRRRSRQDR